MLRVRWAVYGTEPAWQQAAWRRRTLEIGSDHWLRRGRRRPSPNAEARPPGAEPELVVLHGISLPPGRFATGLVERLFLNRLPSGAALAELQGMRVSAHVLIERRGRLTQFVPFDRMAWHAGRSCWRGRPACNGFSVGIELEGTDCRPYTAAQYNRLHDLLLALFERYPRLSPEAVVGHAEIAPGRKTDPGPVFDWPRLLGPLSRELR